MAINKVVYGNNTLIDLTSDTVEASNLLEGETAHDRSGSPVTGTAKQGHIVQNSSGTDMTQRGSVQFTDAHLTDDSQNDKTKVEVVKSVASADYSSETEDGLYLIPDGDGSVIEPASEDYVEVTADGNTTWADLLKSVFNDAKFDISKVNKYSKLAYSTNGIKIYDLNLYFVNGTTSLAFSSSSDSSYDYAEFNGSFGYFKTGGTDVSSNKPTQGATLTLYYGQKKAVVDLQTTANRCLMSDGDTSVESYINSLGNHKAEYITLGKGWKGYAYAFVPLLNANKYTITITEAIVYGGSQSPIDITNSVLVGNKTRDGFNIEMSNNTYVGECVRLSFTVS